MTGCVADEKHDSNHKYLCWNLMIQLHKYTVHLSCNVLCALVNWLFTMLNGGYQSGQVGKFEHEHFVTSTIWLNSRTCFVRSSQVQTLARSLAPASQPASIALRTLPACKQCCSVPCCRTLLYLCLTRTRAALRLPDRHLSRRDCGQCLTV